MKATKEVFSKIKEVVFITPNTIVYFNDGTKSIAPYDADHDPFTGYITALANYAIPEEYTLETIFDSHDVMDATVQYMFDSYKLMMPYGINRESFNFGHNEKMLFLLSIFIKDFNKYKDDYINSVFKLIESNYDMYDVLNPNVYHKITFDNNNNPSYLQWKTINTSLDGEQFANQLKKMFLVIDENYKKASIFRDVIKEDNQKSQLSDDDLMYKGLMIMLSQIGELKQSVIYSIYNDDQSKKRDIVFKPLIARFYYGLCLYTTYNTVGEYKDCFAEYICDAYHDNEESSYYRDINGRYEVMLSEIDNILFHITKLAGIHERVFYSIKNLDTDRELRAIFKLMHFIVVYILHGKPDDYFVINAPE